MPLLEKNYRVAATAELERNAKALEERDKIEQNKPEFMKDTAEFQNNVNFAERLNLINHIQAEAYRERAVKLLKEQNNYERLQKTEIRGDIVDDFENSRERADRYQDMDKYKEKIAQERAKNNEEKQGQDNSRGRSTKSNESMEHAR